MELLEIPREVVFKWLCGTASSYLVTARYHAHWMCSVRMGVLLPLKSGPANGQLQSRLRAILESPTVLLQGISWRPTIPLYYSSYIHARNFLRFSVQLVRQGIDRIIDHRLKKAFSSAQRWRDKHNKTPSKITRKYIIWHYWCQHSSCLLSAVKVCQKSELCRLKSRTN